MKGDKIKGFLHSLGIDEDLGLEDYNPTEHINKENLNKLYNFGNELEDREDLYEKYGIIENQSVVGNIVSFTVLRDKIVREEKDGKRDLTELESLRMFPLGSLKGKGIFYSEGKQKMIEENIFLRRSSLYQTITDEAYNHRYIMPICLPNGDVVAHTGYRPNLKDMPGAKYETAYYDWMTQGSLLGNLESIEQYPSREIYVTEGFFDAYRINIVLNKPSVAILGSTLTVEKRAILSELKQRYKLILVPDQDEAGQSDYLLKNKLFSNVMSYGDPYDEELPKDFDFYCGIEYIKRLKEKHDYSRPYKEFSMEDYTILDLTDEDFDICHRRIKENIRYKYSIEEISMESLDIMNYL